MSREVLCGREAVYRDDEIGGLAGLYEFLPKLYSTKHGESDFL